MSRTHTTPPRPSPLLSALRVVTMSQRPASVVAAAGLLLIGFVVGVAQSFEPAPERAARAAATGEAERVPTTAEAEAADRDADSDSEQRAAPPEEVPAPAAAEEQPPPAPAAPPAPKTIAFEGLGTWIDAYDFSREMTRSAQPPVRPEMVDDMAAKGVKTIYIQASMRTSKAKGAILSPDLLSAFIERAHAHGMYVVGWYLPRFEGHDKAWDLQFTKAMADFVTPGGHRLDAIGLDIEWTNSVPSHALRSAILVDYSRQVREALGPDYPIAAITMPPVQTEVVNPAFWPGYPYAELKPYFDVWMTMGYWTDRTFSSGWRHSYNYTVENLARLKAHLGPDVKIHPIGGIGHKSSALDYAGFVRAALEQGAIGASIYDYATQAPDSWDALRLTPSPYAQVVGPEKAARPKS